MPVRCTKFMLLLIAFAVAATLAHVCAVPGHVHASPSGPDRHGHDESSPAHDDAPGDSSYAGCCDALRPPSSAGAPPSLNTPAIITSAEIACRVVDRAVDAAPPKASPALFLIHRSLRI